MDDSNSDKTEDNVEIVSDVKQPTDVTPDSTSRPIIQNQDVQSDPMVTTTSGPSSDIDTSSDNGAPDTSTDTTPPAAMDNAQVPEITETPPINPVNGGQVPPAVASELANSISPEQNTQPTPAGPIDSPALNTETQPASPEDPQKVADPRKGMIKLALIVVGVLVVVVIVAVVIVHK